MNRRIGALGRVSVEHFTWRGAIKKTPRRTDPRTHGITVGRAALDDLLNVRGIPALVVGRIEFGLVQVQPDQRSLHAHHRPSRKRAACEQLADQRNITWQTQLEKNMPFISYNRNRARLARKTSLLESAHSSTASKWLLPFNSNRSAAFPRPRQYSATSRL